jgi:hypothetical protein
MKIAKNVLAIIAGIVAGYLVATPLIMYTEKMLSTVQSGMLIMFLVGLYILLAIEFGSVFWLPKYIKRSFK